MKQKIAAWSCILATALILLSSALILIYEANRLGYFVDEMVNTQAAYNLFHHGNYNSYALGGVFPPAISSGIAVTWPSAIAWSLGGNLFMSRLFVSFYVFFQAMLLGWLFLRRLKVSRLVSLFGAAVFWRLSSQIPYWPGFVQNLGEFSAALWLGYALYFLEKRPRLGFFLMGVAIWWGKFIYIFAALMITAAYGQQHRNELKLAKLGEFAVLFFSPLLTWLSLIAAQYGIAEAMHWLTQFASFVIHGNSGLSGHVIRGILNRIHSPWLEWVGYGMDWKVKILALLPAVIAISALTRDRFLIALTFAITFYYYWYFALHPMMWIRHLQPAMFLSYGILVFFLTKTVVGLKSRGALVVCLLGFVLSGICLKQLLQAEITHQDTEAGSVVEKIYYSQTCSEDLFSKACNPF